MARTLQAKRTQISKDQKNITLNSELRRDLNEARTQFIDAIKNDKPKEFLKTWTLLQKRIDSALDSDQLDQDTIQLSASLAKEINAVAARVVRAAREIQTTVDEAGASVQSHLESAGASILDLTPVLAALPPTPSTDPLPSFLPYRTYFLTHLSHPFPTSAEIDVLRSSMSQTPAQVKTWFINIRRRSGWNEMLKIYGDSDGKKVTLRATVTRVDRWLLTGKGTEGREGERAAVQKIREYINGGGRDSMSSAVVKAVSQAKRRGGEINTREALSEYITALEVGPTRRTSRVQVGAETPRFDYVSDSYESDSAEEGDGHSISDDVGAAQILATPPPTRVIKSGRNGRGEGKRGTKWSPTRGVTAQTGLYETPRRPVGGALIDLPFPLLPSPASLAGGGGGPRFSSNTSTGSDGSDVMSYASSSSSSSFFGHDPTRSYSPTSYAPISPTQQQQQQPSFLLPAHSASCPAMPQSESTTTDLLAAYSILSRANSLPPLRPTQEHLLPVPAPTSNLTRATSTPYFPTTTSTRPSLSGIDTSIFTTLPFARSSGRSNSAVLVQELFGTTGGMEGGLGGYEMVSPVLPEGVGMGWGGLSFS